MLFRICFLVPTTLPPGSAVFPLSVTLMTSWQSPGRGDSWRIPCHHHHQVHRWAPGPTPLCHTWRGSGGSPSPQAAELVQAPGPALDPRCPLPRPAAPPVSPRPPFLCQRPFFSPSVHASWVKSKHKRVLSANRQHVGTSRHVGTSLSHTLLCRWGNRASGLTQGLLFFNSNSNTSTKA